MYLKAIVGAKRGLIPPLESFAAAGGDLTRRVQDTDRLTLAKVAQFVNTGQGLCEIAAAGACGNDAALMWLLERAPTFEDIGVAEREGIRRTTLPSLLSPEMARNANGLTNDKDSSAPLKATTTATEDRSASPPAVTGAGGTVSGAVSKSLSGDGGYDEEEGHIDSQMLAENVRLELLSTREERGDGLIVLDTTVLVPNNFPDPVAVATNSSAATASTKKKTPSLSKSKSAPPSGVEMAAAIAASMPRSSMLTQRPIGASFALPTSIRASIEVVLKAFLEQDAMRGDVDVSMSFFPLVPGCSSAAPLYTVADLNCLLHGAFLTIAGVRDGIFASDDQGGAHSQSRTVLRDALYRSLVQCSPLQMVVADRAEAEGDVL